MDGRELFAILRRRRWSVIATTLACLLVAGAYCILARPLYTATTELLVDPRDRQVVTNDVMPSALSSDGGIAQVESQQKVLASDNVLNRAVLAEALASDPEFGAAAQGFAARLRAQVGGAQPAVEEPSRRALRLLKQALSIKRADKAFVIDVSVTTGDRDRSARISNAIVAAYLQDQAQARADASRRASDALSARLADLRQRVEVAENRVASYRAEHNLIQAGGLLMGEQQLAELNNQVIAARARTAEARSRVEQLEALKRARTETGATAEALGSPGITQLRSQYAELSRQEADLKAQLGSRHPAVTSIESQLANLRRLIGAELARIAAGAGSDLDRATASQGSLEKSFAALKGEAASTARDQIRLRELEREAEAERAVFGTFLTRARETSEQVSIDTTNARVITPAEPPYASSWPPRLIILVGAGLIGLSSGAGLAFLREYSADRTVGSGRPIPAMAGQPVLAVVPRLGWDAYAAFAPARADATPWLAAPAVAGRREPPSADVAGLLRGLDLRGRAAGRSYTLVVAASGDENTAGVVLQLSEAAAAEGYRVLLVDAEPSGRLSAVLRIPPAHDLGDVLSGRTALDDALVLLPRGDAKLLPARPTGSRQAGATATCDEFEARVLGKAAAYELIIIDVGSDLRQDTTRAICPVADGVVLVVETGATRESDLSAAVAALREAGATVRGTVLLADRAVRA